MTQGIPCPACTIPIPTVVAAAPFCPYCGKPKVGASASVQVVSGASIDALFDNRDRDDDDDDDDGARPGEIFSSSVGDLALAFDPQIGFALVGAHKPRGQPWRLRAYDLYNKRVAWEALSGNEELSKVDDECLAVRGRNVYVTFGRILRALDLFTGQPKWAAEFPDKLTYNYGYTETRGLRIIDPLPPGQPGAIFATTVDDTISSIDRDTGRLLWREQRESGRMPRHIIPLDEGGLVVFEHGPREEVVHFSSQTPLLRIEKPIERCDIQGRYAMWQVEHWGWRDREGIVLHDLVANHEMFFEPVDRLEDDVACVMGPGRVFCAIENGERLFAAPHGQPVSLLAGHVIRAMKLCGPTLFVLLEKEHGTGMRRLLGVDPQTLAVRSDLGELTTEPDDDWDRQICTNGQMLVFVTSPKGNDDYCDLLGIDPTGRVLWKIDVGEWRGHYFLGGHVVVHGSRGIQILRPTDGQAVARFP